MYTDEDLNDAVNNGIFSSTAVDEFRESVSSLKNTTNVDEENFRLVGGFNDIFVVIACCLLLFSSLFVLKPINENLGYISFVIVAWALSEFFVLRRKMSLPAIVLLVAFVGGVFVLFSSLFTETTEISLVTASLAATISAYLHWIRFKVPITIAAGTLATISFILSIIVSVFPDIKEWILPLLFISGTVCFCLAMYWDSADLTRTTRKADVAFWLHLAAAPLIIHPVFSTLGVLEGNENLFNMSLVIILYLIMTTVSLVIDRRAFMVSSLVYVIYALSTIMKTYGGIGHGFALTGVIMGALLLLLSAFWQVTRKKIILKLPVDIRQYIPKIDAHDT